MIIFSRKSNFILPCVVILSICFLFESCSHNVEPVSKIKIGGIYRIPFVSEITCLDPLGGELHTWSIGSQILEGLVTFSRDGSQIIPLLAERYEKKNFSLVFYLRKNVRFHNDPCFPKGIGRVIESSDIKYSFERYFNHLKNYPESNNSEYPIFGVKDFLKGTTNHISGFGIVSDSIFIIKTRKPNSLLRQLASHHFFIIPKEAVNYYGEDFKLHPVGTGPFRFSEFLANEKLVIVINENYWDSNGEIKLPYLDAVEYIMYPLNAGEKMLLDFQSGKIDECNSEISNYINDQVGLSNSGKIIFKNWFKENEIKFVEDTLFNKLRYLEINLKNKKIRQAISYGINREYLIKQKDNVFEKYVSAQGPIPPNNKYFNKNLSPQQYNPLKAKELLEDAGYPLGIGLPEFSLLTTPSPDADIIINDLQSIGLKIKKIDPFPGWREIINKENVITRLLSINTFPFDINLNEFAETEECLNDSNFKEYYSTWKKNEESNNMINQIEKMIAEITPVVFLYHISSDYRFLHKYVRGRQLGNAWGQKLQYVWLDK